MTGQLEDPAMTEVTRMPLTPEDVASRKFTVTRMGRSGYDETEVDEFLDEVEGELTRLHEQNAKLQSELDSAGPTGSAPPAAPAQPPEVQATAILAMAQRTAEEYVSEARKQADQIRSEAQALGQQREREIEERRQAMLGDLQREQAALQATVEELRSFEREYRDRLRDYLQDQLRELDADGDGLAPKRSAVATAGPAFATFGAGGRAQA